MNRNLYRSLNLRTSTESLRRAGLNWASSPDLIRDRIFDHAMFDGGWNSEAALVFASTMIERHAESFSVSVYDTSVRKWETDAEFVTRELAWEICQSCKKDNWPVQVVKHDPTDRTYGEVVYTGGMSTEELDRKIEAENAEAEKRGEIVARLWLLN